MSTSSAVSIRLRCAACFQDAGGDRSVLTNSDPVSPDGQEHDADVEWAVVDLADDDIAWASLHSTQTSLARVATTRGKSVGGKVPRVQAASRTSRRSRPAGGRDHRVGGPTGAA